MKIAIVQFPGSNCERETALAVKRVGMEPLEFLWNENPEKLTQCQGYILVGGFSYEDRSRAGIIAALDPILTILKTEEANGKPLLGICNGAQILVEAGFVPGINNHAVSMVLAENKRVQQGKVLGTGYYNTWVHLKLASPAKANAFTQYLSPNTALRVPIAHGEGRFVASPALLKQIVQQGLGVLRYCNEALEVIDEFPTNPNGSMANLAAICNTKGNVMAIMPHPERTRAGDILFQSMRDFIANGNVTTIAPIEYQAAQPTLKPFVTQGAECILELQITDNHALTVQNRLQQLGIPVTVRRCTHFEMTAPENATIETIKQSGVLFNPRKEKVLSSHFSPTNTLTILVRPKEDVIGQEKLQTLKKHFAIDANAIQHGVLWQFSSASANVFDYLTAILQTNIIANPYAHDCYQYNR